MRRHGASAAAIERALLAENAAAQCEPPKQEEEVRRIARDIGKKAPGAGNPLGPGGDPLQVVDIHSFLAMDIPPRETMLEPWLPCQGLAMLYGRRGMGKTYLALGIGYAVGSGGGVLGWQAPKARKVLYIDGEMLAGPL